MDKGSKKNVPLLPKQQLVILVHGFNRSQSDMFPMKHFLQDYGYQAITVNLPLRFSTLNRCVSVFKEQLQQIMVQHRDYNKIHLVGYSMGGLVIRSFLACNDIPQLGRCVLIATPNQGTKLADISEKYLKPLVLIVRPLQVLTTNCLNIGQPMNQSKIEIGVIAGNKNNHPLGVFLTPDSDGLVEVESTKYTDMSDFIIVPYGHLEIHRQTATAQLVHRFLQTGSFRNLNNE